MHEATRRLAPLLLSHVHLRICCPTPCLRVPSAQQPLLYPPQVPPHLHTMAEEPTTQPQQEGECC